MQDGEEMSQVLPSVQAEQWPSSKVSGWYSDHLASAKVAYLGDEKTYWIPPKIGDKSMPRCLAESSELVEARQKDWEKRRQAEVIKAAELDENILEALRRNVKDTYPGEDQCWPAMKKASSRHEGEKGTIDSGDDQGVLHHQRHRATAPTERALPREVPRAVVQQAAVQRHRGPTGADREDDASDADAEVRRPAEAPRRRPIGRHPSNRGTPQRLSHRRTSSENVG